VITDSPLLRHGGVQVIISGINFQDVKGVSFNGISATGFGKPAENQINASVPANATTGPIRVTNAFGASAQPLDHTGASHHELVVGHSKVGTF
jgi:hypothetical protein